ncbi:radical SAM protein [bacterium]|nr:radical SAM protein [bacterium]
MQSKSKQLFSPECLTISLGSRCHLDCLYCFSKNQGKDTQRLSEGDFIRGVSRAAELVAKNCSEKNIPFFLGFQGSGEPLEYFKLLKQVYGQVESIVAKNHLNLFAFITSNGCMEADQYQWVAERFQRVCLSIDGDERLHNIQRPGKNGEGTYGRIIKTLQILQNQGVRPAVRMTVTRHNVQDMSPIIRHFIDDLQLSDIQAEPVYQNASLAADPVLFAENFIRARNDASDSGAVLKYSGYRSHEKHGPYCNMNRNVLYVGPGGTASICLFKDHESRESPFVIGYYHTESDRFVLLEDKINRLIDHSSRIYRDCELCEIVDSCVRGCPDVCIIKEDSRYPIKNTHRCQINRLLYKNGS